ncbi:odorant receptor 83a-like [Atheta coriaria]|uniref:odorant receptor 83a-like n=1 Tax=Dalotia coriaria TaxID=877792 RepID=UPI0031F34291
MHIINIAMYSSIVIRSFYFMYNYDSVEYLMARMNMVMKESGSFAFDKYTMKRGRRLADMALLVWQGFVWGCGLLFSFSPLFKSNKELPLPMWLFYDWTTEANFYITLLLQTFAQVFMVCCFANIEMFNICFHILMQHQFELLGNDFKFMIPNVLHNCGMSRTEVEEYMENPNDSKLIQMVDEISNDTEFKSGVLENLHVCIAHHQRLLAYRDEFYEFISPLLIIELNFIFAYMIFVLFTIVTTDNKAMYMALVTYFFAILTQVFIITFFGERLTNKAEELRTILFKMPWYICDRNFLLDFKFLQMRVAKNNYLQAGKLMPISLEVCMEFIKKAASFFAVLRQVNE